MTSPVTQILKLKNVYNTLKILSLALLVLRIGANYPNHSAPVNHLALITNLFNARSNFHSNCSSAPETFSEAGHLPHQPLAKPRQALLPEALYLDARYL
jgi:hypothetical protein